MTGYGNGTAPSTTKNNNRESANLMNAESAGSGLEAGANPIRVLIPINAKEDSRWGIYYALRRHHDGTPVEAILLNVGEPITQWEVLRFRTQQEISEFQSQRAQFFIEDACQPLAAAGVPWRGLFKQGEVAFTILDTAEELGCDEIVMPAPKKGLASLFCAGVVADVMKRARGMRVVIVGSEGIAA